MTRNVAASVKSRLLAQARATGEEFERTLVRFAAERVLYRLGAFRSRTAQPGMSICSVPGRPAGRRSACWWRRSVPSHAPRTG